MTNIEGIKCLSKSKLVFLPEKIITLPRSLCNALKQISLIVKKKDLLFCKKIAPQRYT